MVGTKLTAMARFELRSLAPRARSARVALLVMFLAFSAQAQPASVETVQFQSRLLNATLPYNVILPADYRSSTRARYPVLYLLHGYSGHYSDWVTKTNLAEYAAQYRMIIVMPEGNNGWYTDSVSQPANKYESYLLKELIPDVQQRYRTIESGYGRGIAGLSMGGYGALKLGLKFPGTFAFAGSMSGVVAITSWTDADYQSLKSIHDSVVSVFGPVGSEARRLNDIFEIGRGKSPASIASLPYLYFDCGTEDFLVFDNNRLAALLREKKIPHEFRELPGEHTWSYWNRQVQEVLQIAVEKLHAVEQRKRIGRSKTNAKRLNSIAVGHAHGLGKLLSARPERDPNPSGSRIVFEEFRWHRHRRTKSFAALRLG